MNFLDTALDCIRRGWYVLPCMPRDKNPLGGLVPNGVTDASNDEETIRRWWKAKPDANVGIACEPSGITVVDCDHGNPDEASVRAWIERAGLATTYTVRTGRRFDAKNPDTPEFGVQLYYLGAMPSGHFSVAGCSGDIRSQAGKSGYYVMATESVHPVSSERYEILVDAPLVPLPEHVRGWIKIEPKTQIPDGSWGDGTLEWLLGFLERNNVEARTTPEETETGWKICIVCPWESEHSGGRNHNDTIAGVHKGRYVFDCKHRCNGVRDWAAFRDWVETPAPVVVLGKKSATVEAGPDEIETEQAEPHIYPIAAWNDTVVSEYAKLCSEDNNVPRALYAEAFRCALGAVLGDRLVCPDVDGAHPRSYTVLIAPFGKGKGTAIDRAVDFFSEGIAEPFAPPFLSGSPMFSWKPHGLGAWKASANSVPGMARLLREPKDIASKPHMAWRNTLPRVFSVHEEMKTLLSALFIEGGTGSGLGGVVCQLWDRPSFFGAATGMRDAQFGEMLFSMLCGVTPDDWDDLLSHGDVVGGGLFSRLNIVSTEGEYENVGTMRPPHFGPIRETFLPRIVQLQDAAARVHASDAARAVIGEWTKTLPKGSQRMNIHAWRAALLLAWLRREDAISERTTLDAVALGDFQVREHERFRPQQADNPLARVQNAIVTALTRKGALKRGRLQDYTNARRAGTDVWGRALDGLLREGIVGKDGAGNFTLVEANSQTVGGAYIR